MNWLRNLFGKLTPEPEGSVASEPPPDEDFWEDLEETLLSSDCGVDFTEQVLTRLRSQKPATVGQVRDRLREFCLETLRAAEETSPAEAGQPHITLVVGVNGSGKTTTIGKLARRSVQQGYKTMILPCDTFRAAAPEQLAQWSSRAGAEFFWPPEGVAKPDAILYAGVQESLRTGTDHLLVDTAGRLQSKSALMDELARLARVLRKHAPPESKCERLLVIDATTGQNGYRQAQSFREATELTGMVLSKLDGTAKGGIVLAIAHGLDVPIRYVGTGEGIDDLGVFDADKFAGSLAA